MSGQHDTKHIWQALFTNLFIAIIKGVAAVFTRSGSMLAEAIHSFSDCANQLLLLLGVRSAQKAPDASHPLGYGRSLYFWSFMVALLLFTGGGVFSVYEGIHKISHPEALAHVEIGIAILAASFFLEGFATLGNIREIKKRAGGTPFFRFVRATKDSDLVVIFGENSAATGGLFVAMVALILSWATGDSRWDGVGSFAVGVLLIAVAIFLSVEVKSLLLGEGASPDIQQALERIAATHPEIRKILRVITVQQGPGEVMVAMKILMDPNLGTNALCQAINAFEQHIQKDRPEIRWSFVEPDVTDD